MNEEFLGVPDIPYEEFKTDKIALIDADHIKYLVKSDLFKTKDYDNFRDKRLIVNLIEERLDAIMPGLDCKARVYLFSGKSYKTFRYHLAREKEYKGNRANRPEDYEGANEDMNFVREYICKHNHSLLFDDLEADDLLGMLQDKDTFIFSKDKDALTVPGYHWDTSTNEIKYIFPAEAWRKLMYQVLGGDGGDGILGLRGWGLGKWEKGEWKPGKVDKLLDPIKDEDLMQTVLNTYIRQLKMAKGLDAFCENYSLVRLSLNRGPWMQKKYQSAYTLMQVLKLSK